MRAIWSAAIVTLAFVRVVGSAAAPAQAPSCNVSPVRGCLYEPATEFIIGTEPPEVVVETSYLDTDFKRSTHSWIRVPRPVLLATGDGDNVCNPLDEPGSCFGDSPFIRRIAFERLTPGNKHLLYLHDADTFHSLFGLNTADCVAKNVAEARCEEIARWLRSMVLAFLDAHLRHEPLAIAWLATDNIVAASGGVAEHRRK